jgi:mannose-6-phosphate isomerase-like protein (cupin superfamily)
MKTTNILEAEDWFRVLQTSSRSQTAVMTLAPGKASGPLPESHENSEQILLVVEGSVSGEIAGQKAKLHRGDVVVIPHGVKHRFTNEGSTPAVTFNVYTPPEYSPGQKG